MVKKKIQRNFFKKYGVGSTIKINDKFIVILQHPVTTEIESTANQISQTIKSVKIICKKFNIKAIWFWPNVDAGTDIISKKLRQFRERENPNYICFIKNLPPENYIKLLLNSLCIIGNLPLE